MGVDVDQPNDRGERPMHYAVSSLDSVKILMEAGANPDLKDADGSTAFDEAVRRNQKPVIEYLRNFGRTRVRAVVFSPAGGNFIGSTMVHMSCATPCTRIFYTTDGSDPTPSNGKAYTAPFLWTKLGRCCIRAIAVEVPRLLRWFIKSRRQQSMESDVVFDVEGVPYDPWIRQHDDNDVNQLIITASVVPALRL
jgi:hypothetical protein